ncbi:MAG TPA: hypothetical protein DCY79_16320 [Planctomycetaceae bacterium]|nr:hypothetical protein [Blastopirellula sp.]MAR11164.1 hypothetical protein [Blastopirellula sp.]HAY81371.1 hypothetical protein [Planctomycetaceae bacterium]
MAFAVTETASVLAVVGVETVPGLGLEGSGLGAVSGVMAAWGLLGVSEEVAAGISENEEDSTKAPGSLDEVASFTCIPFS